MGSRVIPIHIFPLCRVMSTLALIVNYVMRVLTPCNPSWTSFGTIHNHRFSVNDIELDGQSHIHWIWKQIADKVPATYLNDKNSLFEIEVRKNLRLYTINSWIPICSGVGNPTAIFIMIQANKIKIPYSCFIDKTGFCYKLAKIPGFWVQEACLPEWGF